AHFLRSRSSWLEIIAAGPGVCCRRARLRWPVLDLPRGRDRGVITAREPAVNRPRRKTGDGTPSAFWTPHIKSPGGTMRILVTGGTGVIGKPVIDRLIQRGHSVRLLSRNAERDAGLWPERVEPYSGSVSDAGLVRGAAEGCDAVLHIAGIVAEESPAVTFQEVNVEGTRRLLEEAQRAGAARYVYVSSLGASHGASDYHCSKREAEELVRGFQGSWLVLRPGKVYGPGDDVISTLLAMVRTLPAIPTVGWGKQPFQPIWMDDLAQCLVAAAEAEEPAGVTLELAGSEVTTTAEVLEILGEITGRSPPRLPLPA